MARFEITRRADRDLQEIYAYTFRQHGEAQADSYVGSLYERFQILANQPGLARSADRLRRGYLRYDWGSHVIFAKRSAVGIRIVRVLHQRMEPRLHV